MEIALGALLGKATEVVASAVMGGSEPSPTPSEPAPQTPVQDDLFRRIKAGAEVLKIIEDYRRQQLEARFRMYELMTKHGAGHGTTGGSGGLQG